MEAIKNENLPLPVKQIIHTIEYLFSLLPISLKAKVVESFATRLQAEKEGLDIPLKLWEEIEETRKQETSWHTWEEVERELIEIENV